MFSGLFKPNLGYPRWGVPGTLCWFGFMTLAVFLTHRFLLGIFVGSRFTVYLPGYSITPSRQTLGQLQRELQFNGEFISLSTAAGFFIAAIILVAAIRIKKGASFVDYLALRLPGLRDAELWFFVLLGFMILTGLYSFLAGQPIPPEFVTRIYATADSKWLFVLVILLIGPVFHELFFRGFLISGLERSLITPLGAVVVSALIWSLMHYPLASYLHVSLFLLGVIFGLARLQSGSIYLSIGLHMFMNFVTMLIVIK